MTSRNEGAVPPLLADVKDVKSWKGPAVENSETFKTALRTKTFNLNIL